VDVEVAMDAEPGGLTVSRHEDGQGWWEMAGRPPHPALRSFVLRYCGYREEAADAVRRRQVPWGGVVLILGFDRPLRLWPGKPVAGDAAPVAAGAAGLSLTSFAAGLHDVPVFTEHCGGQYGLQVDLTPLGAYRLLGLPMAELANMIVDLADLPDGRLASLADRLGGLACWADRFALLDRVLGGWAEQGPDPCPGVSWAVERLSATGGGIPVSGLAGELGWSRRHLTARFRQQVGLPPKSFARVVRFSRAVELLGRSDGLSWAEVALACGYYDQAHLNRDFRALAGCSPRRYFATAMPHSEAA
jgi:AraC-like DNA-binding protein